MKPSVIAIVKGGLGNQLFAYAAARALAIRRKRELLIDDTSGFANDRYGRRFRLNQFPLAASLAPKRLRLGSSKSFKHKFVRGLNKVLPFSTRFYLSEKPKQDLDQLLGFRPSQRNLYLNGYWQNEAYFVDYADRIRSELEPPALEDAADIALEQEIASSPSICLHIRRQAYSPRLTASYYNNCLQAATGSIRDCRIEVFGDDLDWAKEQIDFGDHPVRFHPGDPDNELRDFRLMAACRHAIVANSSFSWWAAWLRSLPDKRVWTPANPGWPLVPASDWVKVPNRLEK